MTPEQVQQAITKIVGDVEIDMLQSVMIGPYAVEVKARVSDTREWFQGIVRLSELLES